MCIIVYTYASFYILKSNNHNQVEYKNRYICVLNESISTLIYFQFQPAPAWGVYLGITEGSTKWEQ